MIRILLVGGMLLAAAANALAKDTKPECTAIDAALPPGLDAWQDRTGAVRADLSIGTAATVTLLPDAGVRYAVPPEKPGKADSFGGSRPFEVPSAGRYSIALGEGAWVDVVRDGKSVASTAHGHGPDCSSIRKVVTFALSPGRHALQFSGSPTPAIAVLITPAE